MFKIDHKLSRKFIKIDFFLKYLNIKKKKTLRILTFHGIKKDYVNHFINQIKFIKKNYKIISPKQFENHINCKKKLGEKNYVLLTFDDAFKSNFLIAKKILKNLNIKAIFFVPTKFVLFKNTFEAKNFAKRKIFLNNPEFNHLVEENMSISNLKDLIKDGHEIGYHTFSHSKIPKIKSFKILNKEIVLGLKILEKKIKKKIKHFAFPFGGIKDISLKYNSLIKSNFDFIYSSIRGDNYNQKNKSIIYRDTIYLDSPNKEILFFLKGFFDLKYFLYRIILKNI